MSMARPENETGTGILEKSRPRVEKTRMYHVVLLNDDYTTMEFVVEILETVFSKSQQEAYRIMLHVHTHGRGVCGAYSYEEAETKVVSVHDLARERGFPLRSTIEEA
jgi:ATP-dependent Clp protease adaptor protein ClpS